MIMDEKLIFSDSQAETSQGSHPSTNVVDQGGGYDAFGNTLAADAGAGGDIWLNVVVAEAVASSGNAKVTFKLQESDDNATFTDTILVAGSVAKDTLVEGYTVIKAPLPSGLRRYLRMEYTVGNTALTAGKFTAYLSMQPDIS